MAYRLTGTYMESCSCEVACPCGASNLTLPATYDRCEVLLAFHIEEGEVEGTPAQLLALSALESLAEIDEEHDHDH